MPGDLRCQFGIESFAVGMLLVFDIQWLLGKYYRPIRCNLPQNQNCSIAALELGEYPPFTNLSFQIC